MRNEVMKWFKVIGDIEIETLPVFVVTKALNEELSKSLEQEEVDLFLKYIKIDVCEEFINDEELFKIGVESIATACIRCSEACITHDLNLESVISGVPLELIYQL